MKHHLLRASSIAIILACGPAFGLGSVITGATPAPDQTLFPDVSLRPTLSPPSFGSSLFSGAPSSWTGPYFGVNAGIIVDGGPGVDIAAFPIQTGASPSDIVPLSGHLPTSGESFLGGGQFGYNFQFQNNIVAGLEADIEGSTAQSSFASPGAAPTLNPPGTFTNVSAIGATKSLQYLGTVRARLGFLFTPSILAYTTGGLAYGQVGLTSSSAENTIFNATGQSVVSALGGASYSAVRAGWTVGGGLEALISRNWSAKAEYLYYDLGAVSQNTLFINTLNNAPGTLGANIGSQSSTHFNGHVVQLGINYHLTSAPAPIVAKY